MRRYHVVALFVLLAAVILVAIRTVQPSPRRPAPPDPERVDPGIRSEPEADIRIITLTAVGGLYPHRSVLEENRRGNGEYDFWPAFEYIAPYFQRADLALLTLETMQAGPELDLWGVSGYTGHTERGILTFNAPLELSQALKKAGIDLYSLANNHCLDRGVPGLQATLNNVRALGFHTIGAHLSAAERDQVNLIDVQGIRIAFVAYTYGTNGIPLPAGHEYALNLAPSFEEIGPLIDDIGRARSAGADLVAVVPHWGEQYVDRPFDWQRAMAREMVEAGADMILGGHPKFVQPGEWLERSDGSGNPHPVPVIYSLGNFYTDQHYPACPSELVEYGMLLTLEISKDMNSGRVWISGAGYDLHWCHRQWRHRMLVLSEVLAKGPEQFHLDRAQLERLEENYHRNIEIIERYGFSENSPGHT